MSHAGKDTGASKWNEAKHRGTKLIVEEDLLNMVRASLPFVEEDVGGEHMEDVRVVDEVATPSKVGKTTGAGAAGKAGKVPVQAQSTKVAAPSDTGTVFCVSTSWRASISSAVFV